MNCRFENIVLSFSPIDFFWSMTYQNANAEEEWLTGTTHTLNSKNCYLVMDNIAIEKHRITTC
ncbi:hypothetical protein BC941DRAFT_265538 [Chlamydoabsidia padenii]|nr:hypothetical protein BC941DRAFT_265538 [Chlamydoabsidia padenii]